MECQARLFSAEKYFYNLIKYIGFDGTCSDRRLAKNRTGDMTQKREICRWQFPGDRVGKCDKVKSKELHRGISVFSIKVHVNYFFYPWRGRRML